MTGNNGASGGRREAAKKTPAKRVRGTGAAEVYGRLREEILHLALAPGTALDEARLSTRFGLSRSPVREALIRLSAEGLVLTLPNRSTLVAPFDVQMLPPYLDALDLMQRSTTRLAAMHRKPADVQRIATHCEAFEAAAAGHDALAMIETNRDFHLAIAEAGRNPYLTSLYRRLLDEGRRMMRLYFDHLDDTPPDESRAEHRALLDAIEARDADRAEHIAHQHARDFGRRFMEFLRQTHTGEVDVAGALAREEVAG